MAFVPYCPDTRQIILEVVIELVLDKIVNTERVSAIVFGKIKGRKVVTIGE